MVDANPYDDRDPLFNLIPNRRTTKLAAKKLRRGKSRMGWREGAELGDQQMSKDPHLISLEDSKERK